MSDKNGKIIGEYDYLPFGRIIKAKGEEAKKNTFTYTGREYDRDSGLYYYRARYYDSDIGRFLSPDKYYGYAFNPITLNRYTYCANNPIIFVDPYGYRWFLDLLEESSALTTEQAAIVGQALVEIGVTAGTYNIYYNPTLDQQGIYAESYPYMNAIFLGDLTLRNFQNSAVSLIHEIEEMRTGSHEAALIKEEEFAQQRGWSTMQEQIQQEQKQ